MIVVSQIERIDRYAFMKVRSYVFISDSLDRFSARKKAETAFVPGGAETSA